MKLPSTNVFENRITRDAGESYSDAIVLFREIESLLCGAILGEGLSRRVYQSQLNENRVIKFERRGFYQNIVEWETWYRVRGTKLEKWFAPCYALSAHGMYLEQAKVERLHKRGLPLKVPAVIADCKAANFGLFEDRVVCCDYGASLARVPQNVKLVQAKWD